MRRHERSGPDQRDACGCGGARRGLAVLVNNAAITRAIDILDVTVEDWDEIFRLNARGYFLAMQAAARLMKDAGAAAS